MEANIVRQIKDLANCDFTPDGALSECPHYLSCLFPMSFCLKIKQLGIVSYCTASNNLNISDAVIADTDSAKISHFLECKARVTTEPHGQSILSDYILVSLSAESHSLG